MSQDIDNKNYVVSPMGRYNSDNIAIRCMKCHSLYHVQKDCTILSSIVDDLMKEEREYPIDIDELNLNIPTLERSCTRYDCRCFEKGLKMCQTYKDKESKHCLIERDTLTIIIDKLMSMREMISNMDKNLSDNDKIIIDINTEKDKLLKILEKE